ncbi:MAG: phosphomannomutase/phosphoglucomutase [Bdellovibrionales bacterium]|nr:phosphomannomutase/phosphoglucomutase [Bdellovibrionales bacterium]
MSPEIFREYDVRGRFNEDFDADFAFHLGQAYITILNKKYGEKNPTVALGQDARLSSQTLVDALSSGMKKCGAKVLNLGLVTSPITYFSTFALENIHGAIMVTGSHNPPEYNGFKISVGKSTIFGDDIKALEKIIKNSEFTSTSGGHEKKFDIFPLYIERYQKEFGKLNPIPFVLDCGNGAAGCVARKLYESVGLRPKILFEEPDGKFPNHHPDPTVEKNLSDLMNTVKKTQSLVGIGFDGDADRIGLVDENGRMILGDELIFLYSQFILQKNPGSKIIGDVKCSDKIFKAIDQMGGHSIMWKSGHSLIKEKIKQEKAAFGGELSGHIFFSDRNYGFDDALYAGLRILEILNLSGKKISELLSSLPPTFSTPEIRIDTTEEKKKTIVKKLIQHFTPSPEYKINLIDGIRISFPQGWALARASNTQPVLVMRFEAESQTYLDQIKDRFDRIVNSEL